MSDLEAAQKELNQVSLDKALEKTTLKWQESERQKLLLEVKVEELYHEKVALKDENTKLKQQIEEMIAAQRNGKPVRENPEDALQGLEEREI